MLGNNFITEKYVCCHKKYSFSKERVKGTNKPSTITSRALSFAQVKYVIAWILDWNFSKFNLKHILKIVLLSAFFVLRSGHW